MRGGGLYLAFGIFSPDGNDDTGIETGEIAREELERSGLGVQWDGTMDQRLCVPRLLWQRRPG